MTNHLRTIANADANGCRWRERLQGAKVKRGKAMQNKQRAMALRTAVVRLVCLAVSSTTAVVVFHPWCGKEQKNEDGGKRGRIRWLDREPCCVPGVAGVITRGHKSRLGLVLVVASPGTSRAIERFTKHQRSRTPQEDDGS